MCYAQYFHNAIYLTGPTAVGKTELALALAERLDAEIISLDSMAVYRGMDIGTAKPSLEERAKVRHHLIDIVDPSENHTAADYRERALAAAMEIEAGGKRALFAGGSPLYLKTLLRGLFAGPPANDELRAQIIAEAQEHGAERVHRRLAEIDPRLAERIAQGDLRRIVRGIEVYESTGRPMSELLREHDVPAPPKVPVFALARPRPELNRRIDLRVDAMFAAGLVAEVRGLVTAGGLGRNAAQAVGYREVLMHLAGEIDLATTISMVKTRTRQFAKRQGTWFRSLSEVKSFPLSEAGTVADSVDRLARLAPGYGA